MQYQRVGQLLLKYIATLGPIGYLPVAPGTFGSLAALALFVAIRPSVIVIFFMLSAVIVVGIFTAYHTERLLNEKDSKHIVIDEFGGFIVSVLSLPPDVPYYLAAFLLFRFFDILKPPPVRYIEKSLPGGVGIMADDLMAGLYANVLLQLWKFLTAT